MRGNGIATDYSKLPSPLDLAIRTPRLYYAIGVSNPAEPINYLPRGVCSVGHD